MKYVLPICMELVQDRIYLVRRLALPLRGILWTIKSQRTYFAVEFHIQSFFFFNMFKLTFFKFFPFFFEFRVSFAEILLKLYDLPIRTISSGSDSSMASTISSSENGATVNVSQVFIRLVNRIVGTMIRDSKSYQTRINFINLCFVLLAGCDSNLCLNNFVQCPTEIKF